MLRAEEWAALTLSLKVSVVATLLSLPIALAIAWLLARRQFWGKAWLSALVHLPLVLPPVVTGYALLVVFGRRGWIGSLLDQWDIGFTFSWIGAALAAGVMAFPLVVRPIRLSFEAQDARLAEMIPEVAVISEPNGNPRAATGTPARASIELSLR